MFSKARLEIDYLDYFEIYYLGQKIIKFHLETLKKTLIN